MKVRQPERKGWKLWVTRNQQKDNQDGFLLDGKKSHEFNGGKNAFIEEPKRSEWKTARLAGNKNGKRGGGSEVGRRQKKKKGLTRRYRLLPVRVVGRNRRERGTGAVL